jgi:hypothetical protein
MEIPISRGLGVSLCHGAADGRPRSLRITCHPRLAPPDALDLRLSVYETWKDSLYEVDGDISSPGC